MKNLALIMKFLGSTFLSVSVMGGIAGQFGWIATLEGTALPLMDVTLAIIGVTIGAVVYGAGFLIEKKVKTKMKPPVVLDPANLGFIYETLRKHRNGMLGLCIFMSVLGSGLLLTILLMPYEEGSTIPMLIIGILTIVCLGFGLRLYVAYSKIKDVRQSRVYHVIVHEPGTITHLIAKFIKKAGAPGTMGQRISLQIMQEKKKLATLTISETNLELLRQHIGANNQALKFETESIEV